MDFKALIVGLGILLFLVTFFRAQREVVEERENGQRKRRLGYAWNVAGHLSFLVSIIMIFQGFSKRQIQTATKYVGGDAYNYIINSSLSNGFFILALLFTVSGVGFHIIGHLIRLEILLRTKD